MHLPGSAQMKGAPPCTRGVQGIEFGRLACISVIIPFNRAKISLLQDGKSEHFELRAHSGEKEALHAKLGQRRKQ